MHIDLTSDNREQHDIVVDPKIFRAYDIRGTYPEQINEDVAYLVGRAFATYLRGEFPREVLRVAVGGDMRLSSPGLRQKVIEGLTESGVNVEDMGLVSTPTFYFGVAYFGYSGGIQVSASHNPKNWNGFKMVRRQALPLNKNTGLASIKEIIDRSLFLPLTERKGVLTYRDDVLSAEVNEHLSAMDVANLKNFKIVADAGNAMGSLDLETLFTKLPSVNLVRYNFELDGNFPAHEADPMKAENIEFLRNKVIEEGADLGIATDGDGDRIFIVDEKGEVIPPHILRGLLAVIELRDYPGAKIAYDVRPGRITEDMIRAAGGQPLMTPAGHSLIKEAMIREGAVFGGESSGHYFYRFLYGTFEAPMILIVKFLRYVSMVGKPVSEIVRPLKKYSHSGEINIRMDDREKINEKIHLLERVYNDGLHFNIDGLSVVYPNVWFNVRASNTEPLVRLTVEAKDDSILREKTEELRQLLVN